ncbi:MAG: hypothetical protein AABX48_01460 [Nanoarchaeota archaeon]
MPRRIIIAEDDEDISVVLKGILSQIIRDCKINTVSNGKELVDRVRSEEYD